MNPGAGLDSLPILDNPDKLVHAYAALIGETYLHCHQYRTATPLLYELPYSLHLQKQRLLISPSHMPTCSLHYLLGITDR